MKNNRISENKKNTENGPVLHFCKSLLMSGLIEDSWILISVVINYFYQSIGRKPSPSQLHIFGKGRTF